MKILVLDGDGIGPEIAGATVRAVDALNHRLNLGLEIERADSGLSSLEKNGATLTDDVMAKAADSDGVILGPTHSIVYPAPEDGGINLSPWFRKTFDLYANIRPSKARAGVPAMAPDMDLVIARENTEGFYADRSMYQGSGEFLATEDVALAVRKITRSASQRIAESACRLAMTRRRKLTIVHKRNVLKLSDGLFYDTVLDVAAGYDGLEVDEAIIDAMTALVVRHPGTFDVVVTTNMFGDILSDLCAELSGGLGLGPSINAGANHAIAQAAHGSAPDIAGKNTANPTALLLSTSMLLEWLGDRHGREDLTNAARRLDEAVDAQLADAAGRTADLGGPLGTDSFGEAIASRIAG
ncbi:MAG: isocitrate/isopropylmalate dehydrogenase family protein [Alphaproteobacteria bacterium]|nr:isocitrate/isopropylmalate dehydrogenase family protein [Alphaproteobacteria bacterium]